MEEKIEGVWGAACWSDRLMRHGLVCVGCVVV